MGRAIIFTLLLFIYVFTAAVSATAPKVVKATYEIKDAVVSDTAYEVAIFNVDFDQELYLMENFPCPCESCSSVNYPPANEAGYNITSIAINTWDEAELYGPGSIKYYKIDLDNSLSCSNIYVEVEILHGFIAVYGGNSRVPTASDYDWYRPVSGRRYLPICNAHRRFGLGTLYIGVRANQPLSEYNRYKMRVISQSTGTCPAPRTMPAITSEFPADFQWLQDSIPTNNFAEPGVYNYYGYLVETECVRFAASIHKNSSVGDVDLFVSTIAPPTGYEQVLDPREDWVSALDGEDSVSFYHCSKTVPFTIWLAVTAYDLPTGYDIIATTQDSTFMYNPLSTIALNSPGNELTRHFRMECSNPDNAAEVEQFYCEFPGFVNCVSEEINCCFPMYPIAPTKTSNPLWPWNAAISQLTPLATITWEDQDYNAERISNRVSIALMHTIHHDEQHFHYTRTEDFSNCKLSWLGRITNKDGEAFLEDTTFEPKELKCTEGIATLVKDTAHLIDQLSLSTDYLQLTKVHYNLIFKYLSDDWFGCRDMVMGLANTTQIPGSTDYVHVCQHYPGTPAYDQDPCCNVALRFEQCCPAVPSSEFFDVIAQPMEAAINAQCASPQCTKKQLKYLGDAQKRALDRDNGCTAVLTRDADPHSINFLSTFIHDCQKQIYGEQLEGIKCTNDSDCASNSCNKTIGFCNQGIEETLSCLTDSIDPAVARFLFNSWKILDDATPQRMQTEFRTRFVKSNQCVGSTSINYRDHYLWGREEVTCSDDCLANNLETRCLDTTCAVDPSCNYFETGLCHRNYYFTRGDPSGCLSDKRCNWLDCAGLTDAQCETACNTFTTDHFCADCRAGNYPYCKEVTSRTSESECNTGICDIEGVDSSLCETTQSCTAKCNGANCLNQTICESSGVCSDMEVFAKFIELTGATTGVCLTLPVLNTDGFAQCDVDTHMSTAVGCADFTLLTENTCKASGQRWWKFATTQAECASFDICRETYGEHEFTTWKTPQQCTSLCASASGTAFTWTKGVWFTGTLLPLTWTPRQYVSVNSLGDTFDFLGFRKEVRNAIALKLNYAFTTESLCRYESVVKMVGFAACDCNGGFNMNCADNLESDLLIGATLACPYIESTVTAPPSFITIFKDTVSRSSFCTVVHIHRTPALSFELENTLALSSEIYTRKLPNTFSVVKNNKGANIGQIVSDSIELQLEFDDPSTTISNPFELCIAIDSAIGVYPSYTEYGFGVLNVDTNVITASEVATTRKGDQVCAKVRPGHYVIVAHLPDGEWQAVEPYDEAQAQMKWVGVAFYFAGVAFGVFQIIIIALNRESLRHSFNKKILFAVVTVVFLLLRGIYFTFPPQLLSEQFVIQYLLFELPTFMFFSLYTIVLFLWNQVLIKQSVMARGRSRIMIKKAFIGYLIANCVMYAIFVAFVLIYRFWVGSEIACANEINTSTSQDRFYITLAYRIFIAVVCFGVSLAFLVQGIRFIVIFRKYKMVNTSGKKARIRVLITFIAVLCTGLFIGRTIVFLYAAVTGNQVVVVIFVLFEALPSYALLYYLRPFNSKEIFGVSTDSTGTNGSSHRSASARESQRDPGSSAHPASSSVGNTNDDDNEEYPEDDDSSSENAIAIATVMKPEEPVAESSTSSDSEDKSSSTEPNVEP